MGRHVFLGVTSSCAEVVTLCATEISFSCMGYHVFFEGTSLCAGVVTLRAIKRLFSTMNQHVSFQISSFDAWVAALVATVGFLSIMLKQMCFEVFGHLKGEIAMNTCVRFIFSLHFYVFSSVCTLIDQSESQVGGNWRQQKVFLITQCGTVEEKWKW